MPKNTSKIHFIAMGGSVMHDLAINLARRGNTVTGSDDVIYDPAKTSLEKHGLLPAQFGWFPEKITPDLDAIILGMHARADNPELLRAQDLGLQVYSYPEYVYLQSQDKQRIVVAGSHGKTTITAMILHVLAYCRREFDYVIGAKVAQLPGMIKLTDAPIIIIEGDEYLSSPIDRTPKFLKYHHHIGLISGVAWDHYNVFPSFDEYVKQFDAFADATPKAGTLIYCEEDDLATIIGNKERKDVSQIEYSAHKHVVKNGVTLLKTENGKVPVKIFGYHNMQNVNGALAVCKRISILPEEFYEAIQSFEGASKRLERVNAGESVIVFKDFAHAPSKLKATTRAVKEQFPDRKLIACMELHTYSSLNEKFINQYQDAFEAANVAIVYHNPKVAGQKKLNALTDDMIKNAFNRNDILIFTESAKLLEYLQAITWKDTNLLMMSSGTFDGVDIDDLGKKIVAQSTTV
jgi:UDP-N-acetylmuramate: L-alanyl-gamma-D-glutamyl-meso-diaminopimelate ligase